jgi:hypothetical protein
MQMRKLRYRNFETNNKTFANTHTKVKYIFSFSLSLKKYFKFQIYTLGRSVSMMMFVEVRPYSLVHVHQRTSRKPVSI